MCDDASRNVYGEAKLDQLLSGLVILHRRRLRDGKCDDRSEMVVYVCREVVCVSEIEILELVAGSGVRNASRRLGRHGCRGKERWRPERNLRRERQNGVD